MDNELAIKPAYEIKIAGINVTDDISRFLSSLSYSDKLEDASGEIQIVLDDIAGLWRSSWYPTQGDTLTLKIGYEGGDMLDCGLFEIDECESDYDAGTFTIKAISAAITESLRTRNSRAYENQTLKDIAKFIADKHGLKLMGDTSLLSDIEINRKTQDKESDLSFLNGLSKQYGIIFSVRGEQLVFIDPEALEAKDAILTFMPHQVTGARFKDKTSDTYENAVVSQRDVRSNKVVGWKIQTSGDSTKQDEIIVPERVENESQAQASAKGTLRNRNKDKLTGSFTIDGNPLIRAGVNIDLQDFDWYSGKWTVSECSHVISVEDGYRTDVKHRKGMRKRTLQTAAHNNTANEKDWKKIVGL